MKLNLLPIIQDINDIRQAGHAYFFVFLLTWTNAIPLEYATRGLKF